jgi:hypothetical protein
VKRDEKGMIGHSYRQGTNPIWKRPQNELQSSIHGLTGTGQHSLARGDCPDVASLHSFNCGHEMNEKISKEK